MAAKQSSIPWIVSHLKPCSPTKQERLSFPAICDAYDGYCMENDIQNENKDKFSKSLASIYKNEKSRCNIKKERLTCYNLTFNLITSNPITPSTMEIPEGFILVNSNNVEKTAVLEKPLDIIINNSYRVCMKIVLGPNKWNLLVGEKEIDLVALGLKFAFNWSSSMLETVVNVCNSLKICRGKPNGSTENNSFMEVNNGDIMYRSKYCNRVLLPASYGTVCRSCHRNVRLTENSDAPIIMPQICVAGGCSNTTDSWPLHIFPKDAKLRRLWVKAVRNTRQWPNGPSDYSVLCGAHFEESCYEKSCLLKRELMTFSRVKMMLKKDAVPTIFSNKHREVKERITSTKRRRKQDVDDMIRTYDALTRRNIPETITDGEGDDTMKILPEVIHKIVKCESQEPVWQTVKSENPEPVWQTVKCENPESVHKIVKCENQEPVWQTVKGENQEPVLQEVVVVQEPDLHHQKKAKFRSAVNFEDQEPVLQEVKCEDPEPVLQEVKCEDPEPVLHEVKCEDQEPVLQEVKLEDQKPVSQALIVVKEPDWNEFEEQEPVLQDVKFEDQEPVLLEVKFEHQKPVQQALIVVKEPDWNEFEEQEPVLQEVKFEDQEPVLLEVKFEHQESIKQALVVVKEPDWKVGNKLQTYEVDTDSTSGSGPADVDTDSTCGSGPADVGIFYENQDFLNHTIEMGNGAEEIPEGAAIRNKNKQLIGEKTSGNKPYVCIECKQSFKALNSLLGHVIVHKARPNYVCDVCNRIFTKRGIFTAHTSSHCGQPFLCNHCGSRFATERFLKRHVRKCVRKVILPGEEILNNRNQVIGKKLDCGQYGCIVCSKRYKTISGLISHARSHEPSSEYYVCEVCNQSFRLRGNLRNHVNKHSGDYKCNECGRRFHDAEKLAVHGRVHEEKKREEIKSLC